MMQPGDVLPWTGWNNVVGHVAVDPLTLAA